MENKLYFIGLNSKFEIENQKEMYKKIKNSITKNSFNQGEKSNYDIEKFFEDKLDKLLRDNLSSNKEEFKNLQKYGLSKNDKI